MHIQFATVLLALAAPLYAIKITSPSKNDVVDPSKGVTVKWDTVGTDPARAHLVLVNMASGHTPFSKDLGEVDLSAGSFDVTEKDVPSDEGYQFNFESVEKLNTGILAQSEQFEVKASSGDESDDNEKTTASSTTVKTATVTSSAASSDAAVSSTGTATTLATVSSSATGTATENTGSATGSATSSASTGAAAPTAMAVPAGGLLALVAGIAAVMA